MGTDGSARVVRQLPADQCRHRPLDGIGGGTEWPRHETEPVGRKGRQQGRHIVARREKVLRDHAGDKGIHCEVVPLEHVADDSSRHRLATIGFIGSLHICAPSVIASSFVPMFRSSDSAYWPTLREELPGGKSERM